MIKHPVSDETAQRFIDNDFHDRGMMKWQGFMLSDHTAYIEREKHLAATVTRPQQSINVIRDLVRQSLDEHLPTAIQINFWDHDQPIEVKGMVKGVQSNQLFIRTSNGIESFATDSIRNVHFIPNQ
ncbi:hypothetical protein [Lactobacillus sp. Sy-1]|uniref:hypothetical protein n=1 Tax=Lactobacillus sp. Sy-1 TaxID=2109645 RepID=UPI001C5B243E|nr:hypothetical protein [Lactobacillus sp. Sy-1]MBW1606195.1 hypothetical protein [Lactobacillus sp. Sy-1]